MIDRLLKHSFPKTGPTKTRFAPSPTGLLHLGHLYAAIVARDLAARFNGEYLLRFEDIDVTRVRSEYYDAILEDLDYFNLKHKENPISQLQNDRFQAYTSALDKLTKLGVTYPCFCTRKDITEELATLTNAPHIEDYQALHYPGICKKLTQEQINKRLADRKIPSIRLNIEKARILTGELTFNDLRHGIVTVNHEKLGDCILARKDIGTSYHIASVVDDAHQEISHVTRGDDLLDSTHLHRMLQHLLNFPEPTYLHHPLIVDTKNDRLAKRAGSVSIQALRRNGHDKEQIMEMIQQQQKK